TYNERENIGILVPRIHEILGNRTHEIIVVDDRSPDGTGQAVVELSKTVPNLRLISKDRKGIGAALRVGYDQGLNDVLLSTDADLSFDPLDMLRLIEKIEAGYDIVVGCRYAEGGAYETPTIQVKLKFFTSWMGNKIVRWATGLNLHDFSTNFRAIRRDVWIEIK